MSRTLIFEDLQSRRLLAADLDLLACLPAPPSTEVAQPVIAATALQDWSEGLVGPISSDPQAWAAWGEEQAEGEPGGTEQSPIQLSYFEIVVTNNGLWELSGEVEYDGDMNDLQIIFGRDGEGLSTGVAQDGSFSLVISPISNPVHGTMSAQAVGAGSQSPVRFSELPE